MALSIIYIIFLFSFFGDFFVQENLIPPYLTLATEGFIYLLFLYSLIVRRTDHKRYCLHLVPLFVFFLTVALCSIVVNNTFNFRPIFSLRLILRFFIFYLALINLRLIDDQLKKINRLLFILFIIQLPVSAVKFYFYGVAERTHGTYSGGGLTTIIPIIALGYLSGYYTFHKPRVVYLLLGVGFIAYGIVGAKAALFFLLPITFLGLYYLTYIRGKSVDTAKHLSMIAIILLLSIVVGGTIIRFNPRLNAERKVGGNIDFSYALEYSKEYTTGTNCYNSEYATGRFSTTMLTFDTLCKGGLPHILFGYGPGCLTKSMLSHTPADKRIVRIAGSYGMSGMAFILTEYGLFGLIPLGLMFCIFARMCWRWYNYEEDPYWKAFAVGSLVFSFLNAFIFFAYNRLPILGDIIVPVYFYAMATMYLRLKQLTDTSQQLN